MKLQKLLEELSFNELSNLALGNDGNGTIQTGKEGTVISALNSALLDIHSRFLLIERELILRSLEWKSIYPLRIEHAMTNSQSSEVKYILDTPQYPFMGDFIHHISVANEIGQELPMNDPEQCASVFFPQPDAIQLTHLACDQIFFIRYKASHPIIAATGDGYLDQDVAVPLALKNALRYKTAAQIFANMAGQEYSTRVQSLEASYETTCMRIEESSLLGTKELSTNLKLHRRGFI